MVFAFRVGGPDLGLRVTNRGVRATGGPRDPGGVGPFLAAAAVGRLAHLPLRTRVSGPSNAQLERVRRAAQGAPHDAERVTRLTQLHELRRQSVGVHRQEFPQARPPLVPAPPPLDHARATAEAEAFHLRGVGRLARSAQGAARRRAGRDALAYLAAEQARLARIHRHLTVHAACWWQALLDGDEQTVCEAINVAFADDPATGCAVGARDGALSVVLRQPDIDMLPHQAARLTASGRPVLTTLSSRERLRWWLAIMGSRVLATVKEAFATAPSLSAVDLAVLTRVPDTRRLSVVTSGRWTRQALAPTCPADPAAAPPEPDDALQFLRLGEDVRCGVSPMPPRVGAVDTTGAPDLHALVGAAVVDGLDGHGDPPASAHDPYALVPFERWVTADPPPSRRREATRDDDRHRRPVGVGDNLGDPLR